MVLRIFEETQYQVNPSKESYLCTSEQVILFCMDWIPRKFDEKQEFLQYIDN